MWNRQGELLLLVGETTTNSAADGIKKEKKLIMTRGK
jgi:hypothetical protein